MERKINLASSAGFCFGVKRALGIAYKTALSSDAIYMLGDIVHNEDVIKEIKDGGIKKIKRISRLGTKKILLIPAHGREQKIIRQAQRCGYEIVDATCPMVKQIHRIALHMEAKGYAIIIIGDKNHDEVRGIIGQLRKKTLVIADPAEATQARLKGIKKAALVVQSTQNIENVLRILKKLKHWIPALKFFNTVCKPTRTKQEEIKRMPQENDVMVIIGSKASANTRRLYEISKSLNRKSYWVQSGQDIKPEWLRRAKSIGITAGASTPAKTIQKVVSRIRNLN